MRLTFLSFAGFRIRACQFLLAICSAFLNTAAFAENGIGSDGVAHYPEDAILLAPAGVLEKDFVRRQFYLGNASC
jgi:hypothetical protein